MPIFIIFNENTSTQSGSIFQCYVSWSRSVRTVGVFLPTHLKTMRNSNEIMKTPSCRVKISTNHWNFTTNHHEIHETWLSQRQPFPSKISKCQFSSCLSWLVQTTLNFSFTHHSKHNTDGINSFSKIPVDVKKGKTCQESLKRQCTTCH